MSTMHFLPQDTRNWLDKAGDFILNLLYLSRSEAVRKWLKRAGWFFLILAILWLFVKTIYDLHNNYTPTL